MIVSQKRLAEIFGVSVQTVQTWQAAGMPMQPRAKNGKANRYQVADVVAWRVRRENLRADGSPGEQRLALIRLARAEIALTAETSRVVAVAVVQETVERALGIAFQRFAAIEDAAFPKLRPIAHDSDQVRDFLHEFVRDMRAAVADAGMDP